MKERFSMILIWNEFPRLHHCTSGLVSVLFLSLVKQTECKIESSVLGTLRIPTLKQQLFIMLKKGTLWMA